MSPVPRPTQSAATGSRALLCDEYELTMAQSFLRHGQDERVTFELLVRTLPPQRGYLIAAGVEQALDYLETLRFGDDDIEYLAGREIYDTAFLEHLRGLRFDGDVSAVAEGTPIGARTPLLRLTGPRIAATVAETALLAIVNHQTLVASKAARIVDAADGRPVWDFSLRRVHGPEAGLGVARAAYIAGCAGTATVAAGRTFGIPTTGTMAHHFVQRFGPDGEKAAFEQFLGDFPGRAVLLVDTWETIRGVDRAIAASAATGVRLMGIRLDSGDLGALAVEARRRLDAAGHTDSRILASNELDEHSIAALVAAGAPIDAFGVGTALGTSSDAPALGGIYKLVEQEVGGRRQPMMKTSAGGKATDPGVHQVFRVDSVGDTVGLAGEDVVGRPLLEPVMRRGGRVGAQPSLEETRRFCYEQRQLLPAGVRRLDDPEEWPVHRSPGLEALRRGLSEGAAAEHVA